MWMMRNKEQYIQEMQSQDMLINKLGIISIPALVIL